MIIDKNGNTTIVTQENASVIELVKKIEALYPKFKNDNVIVHLSPLKPTGVEAVSEFIALSKRHKKEKQSFVIVSNTFNLNDAPQETLVVPSLQEAYDVIEMEDIERDLGI